MSPTTYNVETSLYLVKFFVIFCFYGIDTGRKWAVHRLRPVIPRRQLYGVLNSLMGSVFGPFSGSLSFLVFGLLASKFYFLFLLSSFTAAVLDVCACAACIMHGVVSPLLLLHNN